MAIELPQNYGGHPKYYPYLLESQNYWAQLRGDENPPAPSYRMVRGKRRLGRYMDPYGCMGLMENQKDLWSRWYTGFLLGAGTSVLFIEVDWVFIVFCLPILALWYWLGRRKRRAKYDRYYRVIEEIEDTGQPVWVPYDKERLRRIERSPEAIWP